MLGQHFKKTHRGCQCNDNGDGTLSLLSAPDKTPGRGDLRVNLFMDDAPIVVSSNALDMNEPPMLPPQKPYWAPGRNPKYGNPEWINVFDQLPSTKAHPQEHGDSVRESSTHVTRSKTKSNLSRIGAVQSAVEYPPCTPNQKPKSDKREQRGRSTSTHISASTAPRTRSGRTSHSGANVPRRSTLSRGKSTSKRVAAPSHSRPRSLSTPRSGANVTQRSTLSSARPLRGGPRRSSDRSAALTSDGDVFLEDVVQSREMTTAVLPRAAQQNPILAGQIAPPAIVPMQDWEFAPGQIHSTGEEERHTFAYSEAALRTEVTLAPGLTFQIMRLEAGSVVHLRPDADMTLQCVLVIGIIQVQVGSEPEFTLGGHGLFLVRPGVTARVQNRVYTPTGAVLHVTKVAHLNH
ncbi:hypothetical protein CONLIGDRAFT_637084 [Coniochaeta ligniaria NRRL 30616]|uniref:Uncharacterized protein n=1 Tax=Coniochaeta ligniaria NRRL 30616 TaxID=1408157 RepID=A0A1J7I8S1_9PEZI|nr:hypothetical protein CONLIGDRAFT_637084 [Coniochaeta ligniaria NRRL 30616]